MTNDPPHGPPHGPGDSAPGDELDELAAECIDLLDHEGPAALQAFLECHPAEADRLRTRLGALSKLGLLTSPGSGAPDQVGPYRLIRRLGTGGMGEVHLAEHTSDGSRVALKLGPHRSMPLSADHEARSERAAERFAREVRAVAAIDHPGIVPIVDVGEHGGRAWFAMAFVEGVGLDRVLEAIRAAARPAEELRGADLAAAVPGAAQDAFGSTWVEAVGRIVLQVADALAAAHAGGVVHRDVKPSNILIRPDGSAQIVDFGLAHLEELPTLTLSGEFAGTPYYVAPEQISNTKGGIDGRADVFSLGVTLYECASLQRPFEGRTPVEVLAAISSREPVPLRRAAPHMPQDLERVCRRALENDRRARYPGMTEFGQDLRCLLDFRPLLTRAPSPLERAQRWARLRPWRAASAGLAAVLVLGAPIGLLIANSKIRSERDLVQAEATRKGAVIEHLVAHFESSGSSSATDAAAHELLDRGVKRIEGDFADQPRVRAALLHASGRAYLELGFPRQARPLLDRSFALWQRAGEDAREERARVLTDLAHVHLAEGSAARAKDIARRALAEAPASDPAPEFLDRAHATVAAASIMLGDSVGAREELDALGEASEAVRGRIASVWSAIGRHELAAGQAPVARDAFARAQDLHLRAWSPNADELARVHDGLADVARTLGGDGDPDALEHSARAARLRASGQSGTAQASSTRSGAAPFRQSPTWAEAYGRSFDRGVAALQAEQLDEARVAFEDAVGQRPSPAVAAYNIACVQARAGSLESAIEWLRRARKFGFACTEERAHALIHDADLEGLRGSSRGQAALRALASQWESAQRFAERAVLRLPQDVEGPRPLLVLLHGDGEDAVSVAEGGWGEIAESLGAILLVPSAPYFVGSGASEGTMWAPDPRDLWQRIEVFERPVLDQVRGVLDREDVDRERVWIAGRGVGGMLALDLLTESPGLFRGGLLIDPAVHERSGGGSGALAAALENRLAVIVTGSVVLPEQVAARADEHADALERWLRDEGEWGSALRLERGVDPDDARIKLLRWLPGD